jgi:hypothetical protein
MNSVVATIPGASKLLGTAVHHLDIDKEKCNGVAIPPKSDLQGYLDALLAEIDAKPQSRAYTLVSDTTELAVSLATFSTDKALTTSAATALAERLLRIEIATDKRYAHLATAGTAHVKRGTFLQFLYQDGPKLGYLAVKVEHQSIVDETDFKRRVGLGDSQKIYKACRVDFDAKGKPHQALVFDTNAKPSVYWWEVFLELRPVRTDEVNTKDAITQVVHVLQRIKKIAPADYTILRNATVAAFKQSGAMDFDNFVTGTFNSYTPTDPALITELPNLVAKLRKLPSEKKFDSHFTLAPEAVPYKKVKVSLNTGITLSYDEDLAKLEDRIWSSKTQDGKDVVVIDAPGATNQFPFKPWK